MKRLTAEESRRRQAGITREQGAKVAAAFLNELYRRETQPLYGLLASYLEEHGYTRGDDDSWAHPMLGVRPFEDCVIWQLVQEGHYGKTCTGWRQVGVPVPVEEGTGG